MRLDIMQFKPSCTDVVEEYAKYDDSEKFWNECSRGDWMLWIAAKLGVDKKPICRAMGKILQTIEHLMTDQRSRDVIQAIFDLSEGKISDEEFEKYAAAAYAATYASAASADYATYAATYAAAASAATYASAAYATYAAYASAAYASDAAASAAYSAKKEHLKLSADICREVLTEAVRNAVMKLEGGK